MQPLNFCRKIVASVCITLLLFRTGWDAEPPTGQQQFEALQKRYQTLQTRIQAEAVKATDEERKRLQSEFITLLGEFLTFEEQHRGTVEGISSLHHLVSFASRYSFRPEFPGSEIAHRALKVLTTHYADHPDLDLFFFSITINDAKASGAKLFLRQAMESPHRHVRGAALLSLAELSAVEAQVVSQFDAVLKALAAEPDKNAAEIEQLLKARKESADVDSTASRQEALRLLDQVIEQYADVLETPNTMPGPVLLKVDRGPKDPLTKQTRRPLGSLAEAVRFELTNLAIGLTAPEIAGPDAFGRDLKLSDHRGKVVVLMFSFKGCGPCEEMYPDNRKLLETYQGRPLSFLGVMGDRKVDTVKEAVDQKVITWPVWWDGPNGPIVTRWNVKGWPSIYVFDHQGILRYRDLRGEDLAETVAQLVKEAEHAR